MSPAAPTVAAPALRRASWFALAALLHLVIAPCAAAMTLMPATADCEHCQTIDNPLGCAVASATTAAVMAGLAFDSSHFDRSLPPLQRVLPDLLLPEMRISSAPPRSAAHRQGSDPPLYLLLGQLRI